MSDVTAGLVSRLETRKAVYLANPQDSAAEIAIWQAAVQLPTWFLVNRGTVDAPSPGGFEFAGIGRLVGVYSTAERAAGIVGEDGSVLAVPLPQALEWLASFAEQGVNGIVLDNPGPWTPLGNLASLKRWREQSQASAEPTAATIAPGVQAAMQAHAADKNDDTYLQVIHAIADASLLVVLDPGSVEAMPTSIVNGRGERVMLAFTSTDRIDSFYAGKEIALAERSGGYLLALVQADFAAIVIDPQHAESVAITPAWIEKATRDVVVETPDAKPRRWWRSRS